MNTLKRTSIVQCLLLFCLGVISHRLLNELIRTEILMIALIGICILCTRFPRFTLVAAFTLGVVWVNLVSSLLLVQSIPDNLQKQDVLIIGNVVSPPVKYSGYTRFDFLIEEIQYQGQSYTRQRKARLKVYHDMQGIEVDQKWQFIARLKHPHSLQNPGSRFNYETYLFENRIRVTGYVRNESENRMLNEGSRILSIAKIRGDISQYINQNFVQYPHRNVLSALIVGIRSNLDDTDWTVLQNTGTIHLVAISGLHIGLVSGLIMGIVAFVWRFAMVLHNRISAATLSVVFGVLSGTGYAFLAGMTIPTRRALVMLSVMAVILILRRKATAFETLVLVLTVVIVIDPLSPLSTGFWLSFGAVSIIVVSVFRLTSTDLISKNIRVVQLSKWLVVQLALSFGLAPLLLLIFNQISLVSPIANLIAIPVIGFVVVPLGLSGLLLQLSGFANYGGA